MRLAVVEDDDGVGDALVEALNARGYRAERMRRGADLLVAHRDFDAVILDLGLPDGDGLQVLRRLREVSSVPVLILTARSPRETAARWPTRYCVTASCTARTCWWSTPGVRRR